MGLFSRTRHDDELSPPAEPRSQHVHRPWVRPEFLGLFIALAVIGGAIFVLSQGTSPGTHSPPAAAEHSDYVSVADLATWTAAHPKAEVLSSTPVYQNGVLAGYNIRYVE